tara:strand:+ start:290 stop:460 length:171 start_codon:yes stop_codon:yes gene_type:complete
LAYSIGELECKFRGDEKKRVVELNDDQMIAVIGTVGDYKRLFNIELKDCIFAPYPY